MRNISLEIGISIKHFKKHGREQLFCVESSQALICWKFLLFLCKNSEVFRILFLESSKFDRMKIEKTFRDRIKRIKWANAIDCKTH